MGAAGNKAVIELIKEGVAKPEEVILVNSTDKDFVDCDGVNNKVIMNPGNTGCGKERRIAKQYAERINTIGSIVFKSVKKLSLIIFFIFLFSVFHIKFF